MSSSSPTKRPADASPADEPTSKRVCSLDPGEEELSKRYYNDDDLCLVRVRLGTWTIRLAMHQLREMKSEFLSAALDRETNCIDLPESARVHFPTFPDLVRVFDDIVPYYEPRPVLTQLTSCAAHLQRLMYIDAWGVYQGKMQAKGVYTLRLAELEEFLDDAERDDIPPLATVSHWYTLFHSYAILQYISRNCIAEGRVAPGVVITRELCNHLIGRFGRERVDHTETKARLDRVKRLGQEFLDSYTCDDDQYNCSNDCLQSCAPDHRCDAHPEVDYDETESNEYSKRAFDTLRHICVELDLYKPSVDSDDD